jgi:hypothetical protein
VFDPIVLCRVSALSCDNGSVLDHDGLECPPTKRKKKMNSAKSKLVALVLPLCFLMFVFATTAFGLTGAIFTTDGTCTGVNVNLFADKDAVHLDGGSAHVGAAGLPAGFYYVQVTEPNGTLLGFSPTAVAEVNALGEFVQCYQLSAILVKASDGSPGYDDTTNGGGVYKVWVSADQTFTNGENKTDNFKVKTIATPPSTLCVDKFYDTNVNGVQDPGEPSIVGWQVSITDNINLVRFTPICVVVDPDIYTVTEFSPTETNWVHTGPQQFDNITLAGGDSADVTFGNVCTGQLGGLTLGFWSNKNGQMATTTADINFLNTLFLRNPNGTRFFPTKTTLPKWLTSASATNMANMLSAQLVAMELNVRHSLVSGVTGSSIVYRPELAGCGISGLSTTGFITINDLMTAANNALADPNGYTLSGNPARTCQEKIKTALDDLNNNKPFYVQPGPCPATFP